MNWSGERRKRKGEGGGEEVESRGKRRKVKKRNINMSHFNIKGGWRHAMP